MTQPPVFTTSDYDSEPGKDFDCCVRYEPMPGQPLWNGLTMAQGVTQSSLDEQAHNAAVEAFREVQRAQEPFERPMRLANEVLQVVQNWLVQHPEFTLIASEAVRIRQEARDARDAVWLSMDGKGKNQAVIDTWDKIAPF